MRVYYIFRRAPADPRRKIPVRIRGGKGGEQGEKREPVSNGVIS